jgi:predicted transcriptional regulator
MNDFFYNELGERESQIMDIVYRLGEADAETVRKELPDDLANSSVRTMLRHLEKKEYLDHRQEGRRYVYYPVSPKDDVRRSLIDHLADTFFDGSVREAALAFLSADESLTPEALDELERRIDEREEGNQDDTEAGSAASGET